MTKDKFRVTVKAGNIASLEYIDCVCGDHGPRNAKVYIDFGGGE